MRPTTRAGSRPRATELFLSQFLDPTRPYNVVDCSLQRRNSRSGGVASDLLALSGVQGGTVQCRQTGEAWDSGNSAPVRNLVAALVLAVAMVLSISTVVAAEETILSITSRSRRRPRNGVAGRAPDLPATHLDRAAIPTHPPSTARLLRWQQSHAYNVVDFSLQRRN